MVRLKVNHPAGLPRSSTAPTATDTGKSSSDQLSQTVKERRKVPRDLPVPEAIERDDEAAWDEWVQYSATQPGPLNE